MERGTRILCCYVCRSKTGIATMEIMVEIPEEAKNVSTPYHSWVYNQKDSISDSRDTCLYMFISVLFIDIQKLETT